MTGKTNNDIEFIKSRLGISDYFNKVILKNDKHYYDTTHIDFDGVGMVKCPIHDENTPSFRYFKDTESFYCFGCNRGGDVINLHQYYADKLGNTMSLKDSISYLKGLIDHTSVTTLYEKDDIRKTDSVLYKLTVDDYLKLDKLGKAFKTLNSENIKGYKMLLVLLSLIDLNKIDKNTFDKTVKSIEDTLI